jgi:hypothetical protein
MGPLNYAYCEDYEKLLPFAAQLMDMGSYSALGASFGPGNQRSVQPVLCTNRTAGVVEPSTAPSGRWCGLGARPCLATERSGGGGLDCCPGLTVQLCDVRIESDTPVRRPLIPWWLHPLLLRWDDQGHPDTWRCVGRCFSHSMAHLLLPKVQRRLRPARVSTDLVPPLATG